MTRKEMYRRVNKLHMKGALTMIMELDILIKKEEERLLAEHNRAQESKNKENGGTSCMRLKD